MVYFRLKACGKCGGDLALDDGDWICLQCGTYYYVHLYRGAGADAQRPPDLKRRPDSEKAGVAAQISPCPPFVKEGWGDFPLVMEDSAGFRHTMVTAALAGVFLASGAVNK